MGSWRSSIDATATIPDPIDISNVISDSVLNKPSQLSAMIAPITEKK